MYRTLFSFPLRTRTKIPQQWSFNRELDKISLTPFGSFVSSPPRDVTKLSQQSVHPTQCCRPLSVLTKFSSSCCLVLLSLHVGSIFPMVIQVNKSCKNQSSIGKHHVIIGSSKLNMHSYLVKYSWQAWCLDTPMYPKSIGQDLYPLTV